MKRGVRVIHAAKEIHILTAFSIFLLLPNIVATMRVYRDLFVYKEGVYRHTAASRSEPSGFHSVRLVGWGETRHGHETTKYWVIYHTLRYGI